MKLSFQCNSCKKENFIKTKATNRHDLLMELGTSEFNERCKHCGNHTKKHINRLYAEGDFTLVLIGLGIAIIATAFLWKFGIISTLTFGIPIWFWFEMKRKASDFNKTLVK